MIGQGFSRALHTAEPRATTVRKIGFECCVPEVSPFGLSVQFRRVKARTFFPQLKVETDLGPVERRWSLKAGATLHANTLLKFRRWQQVHERMDSSYIRPWSADGSPMDKLPEQTHTARMKCT
ncbi:unnamed protein product [Ectocarpus sp. 12 AP-2014]